MAQPKPTMRSFGQSLLGQKINQSAFTSPGMSSPGAFSAVEVAELSSIKKNLNSLLAIEKKYTDLLGDKILRFARTEEKSKLKKKETSQETKGNKDKKEKENPIVKGAMKGLGGLFDFFGNLFKWFIGYKIVEWVSKPENTKKVKDFAKLFLGIFGFISNVVGFGIDKLMSGLSHLVDGGGITRVFGALEMIVGFFTLKWLLNPTKIISDIKFIGNIFTKVIPNTINGILNFFTNLIPSVATQAADTAINEGIKGATEAGKQAAKEGAGAATKGAGAAAKGADAAAKGAGAAAKGAGAAAKGAGQAAAKGAAKGAGKSLLKKLPVIGAVAGGVFAVDRASKGDWLGAGMEVASGAASLLPGWGTAASIGIDAALVARDIAKEKDKENEKLPKLAKGGIVTKPTKAIVGEAGPEAILPLDKLSSFAGKGIESDIGKIIPKFMKLLTIPFTLVGAGIIALMTSSLSMIPGIGPLMMPLIGSIASTFGIPTSIVKGVSKFVKNPAKALSEGAGNISKLFGDKDPKVTKQQGNKFTPSRDTSVRGLLANILGVLSSKNSESTTPTTPPSPGPSSPETPAAPAGGSPPPGAGAATVADSAKESIKKAGGLREDGTLKGVKGTVRDMGRSGKEYSPGGGLKPVINGNRKYWYDATGNVFRWEKPGDPLTDITSTRLFDSKTLGGPLVRIPSTGEVKILQGLFGGDQTAEGMYNYQMGKILKSRANKGPKGLSGSDVWEAPTEGVYGRPAKFNRGGKIRGFGGGDKVPALLEPQEYVLNRNAVRGMGGSGILDRINFGMFPRFQTGGSVLDKLKDGTKLANADPGYCVTGVLDTMAANDVPNPPGTGNDPNNPRGLAVQLMKSYGWGPISGLGSKRINLQSAYGNAAVNAMTVSEWATAVKSNKIPSGSIIFTTEFSDWKKNQSSGHDAAIAKQGGRKLWSGHWQRGGHDGVAAVYGSASQNIFALTPGGKQIPYDGSTSGDDGTTPSGESAPPPVSFSQIAKDLNKLYKGLTGTPTQAVPSATPLPPPAATRPSVPASSSRLQQAQTDSNNYRATQRASMSTPGGNIVSLGQGTNVVNQSTTQSLAPTLGNTVAPVPLTLFPVTV